MNPAMTDIQFHTMPGDRLIAFRHAVGSGPTIVFLPGYMSDMAGGKATAIFDWAQQQGRGCLLLDYSGCGTSPGRFADGSLTRWRDEVLALLEAQVSGPIVLVGSSMGGWLMLLIARELGSRIAGIIGIAAAPDFSDWGFTAEQKTQLSAGQTIFEDNPYGPEPTPTHPLFWQDAENNRQLEKAVPLDCPVRLLHGQQDRDVPWEISLRLAERIRSDDIQVTLVKGADHRMSREEDITLLLHTVAQLPTGPDPR